MAACFDSMQFERDLKFGLWDPKDEKWMQILKENFNAFIKNENCQVLQPKIPLIIHHIWLGSELPQAFVELVKTWHDFHPHWKHYIWTDKDVPGFKLANQEAFDAAENLGEKSDIWRYEILHRYGGLYVDTDFQCLAPFDQFHFKENIEFYTGFSNAGVVELNNGLIGSIPRHPVLQSLIENIQQNQSKKPVNIEKIQNIFACMDKDNKLDVASLIFRKDASNPHQTIERTGPGLFTRAYMRTLDDGEKSSQKTKMVAFPNLYFYPIPNNNRIPVRKIQKQTQYDCSKSFAVHYWAKSWQ